MTMEPNIFKSAKIILIVGVVLILIVPFILTRSMGLFDFSNTGEIGDTIGGITAPISGLIGSALVFFALKAQIDANKIIQQQISNEKNENEYNKTLQYFSSQLTFLHQEIEGFGYLKTSRARNDNQSDQFFEIKGAMAIKEVIDNLSQWGEKDIDDKLRRSTEAAIFLKLFKTFNSLMDILKQGELKKQDIKYLTNKLEYLFQAKISPGFDSKEGSWPENEEVCEKCGQRHSGFPSVFFELYINVKSSLTDLNDF